MAKEILVVGSLNLDMVTTISRLPRPGETMTGLNFERHAGGKGANQAAAAALAGGRVRLVARHGSDGFEQYLLTTLADAGVDITGVLATEGASGVAMILVTIDGQNSIVVVPGANEKLLPADLLAEKDRIAASGIVLSQLETPMATLLQAVEWATVCAVPVMLDPAPVRPLTREILQGVTWLTPNETEAEGLVGSAMPAGSDVNAFAQALLAMGPRNVLLKLGARGAFLATQDGLREMIPGHPVEAIDTTAAGDALNGAMAAALVNGADPMEAARFGVAAAAISVTRKGAIPSLARLSEIEAFRTRKP